ncbi:hypothetical protein BQ6471_02379 [Vibrio gazogenes]|nr:hypothetical protein BQ6471_02379 [Vibrio gazogenes]
MFLLTSLLIVMQLSTNHDDTSIVLICNDDSAGVHLRA